MLSHTHPKPDLDKQRLTSKNKSSLWWYDEKVIICYPSSLCLLFEGNISDKQYLLYDLKDIYIKMVFLRVSLGLIHRNEWNYPNEKMSERDAWVA